MPRTRRFTIVLATTAVLMAPAAASTASAVTVGSNFAGNIDCDGITVVKTVPLGSTGFIVPMDGVLTSWSTNATSDGKRMAAVVYRQIGGDYALVGISPTQVPVGAGLKTYPANIPVLQGDLFGSWVERRGGGLNVRNTCSGGVTGYTTTWWYDSPNDVLPPTSLVSIASIGASLTGSTTDTGWRYDISGEVVAGTPAPAPDPVTPPSPTTPSGGVAASTPNASSDPGGPATTRQAVPRLQGRWTRPSPRGVVRTTGTVPEGASLITQRARPVRGGRATAMQDMLDMAGAGARAGSCAITGTTYRCTIRLAAGRWTITTSAIGAGGTVAQATRRVAVRQVNPLLPVAG